MSLEKVLSISGKPGLFLLKSQTRNGFLAESLLDGKTVNVSGRHSVSLLSEIAIYTLTSEVPLREIFQKISDKEEGKESIGHKATKEELEEYFFGILPDYDEDRVYPSDIKKVIQWYNMLVKNNLNDFSEPEKKAEDDSQEKEEITKEVKAAAIKKSVAPKSSGQKASSSKKGGTTKSAASRKT